MVEKLAHEGYPGEKLEMADFSRLTTGYLEYM
jgi:hypothetical protein